jgi:hypothetical protein
MAECTVLSIRTNGAAGKVSGVTLYRRAKCHSRQSATRGKKRIHIHPALCLIHDMFHASVPSRVAGGSDISLLLDQLSHCCSRPRYAFMLLTLIADVARPDGSAGPVVRVEDGLVPLRDWLCDALAPMGQRDPRRMALVERVREELRRDARLSGDAAEDEAAVQDEVRARVRASGKTNLSRAASELVKAGLLKRHYQGYRVDHLNRGAQRQAVYTLTGRARALVSARPTPARPAARPRQGDLFAS